MSLFTSIKSAYNAPAPAPIPEAQSESEPEPSDTTGQHPKSEDSFTASSPIKGSPKTKQRLWAIKNGRKSGASRREAKAAEKAARDEAERVAALERERAERLKKEEQEREGRALQLRLDQEAKARTNLFQSIMAQFEASDVATLGDFLLHIFPGLLPGEKEEDTEQNVSNDFRWTQFFRGRRYLKRILSFWNSTMTPKGSRDELDEFAINRVCRLLRKEAKTLTASEKFWSRNSEIDDDFVLGFDWANIHEDLASKSAPVSLRILRHIATSGRQIKKGISEAMRQRKNIVSGSSKSAHTKTYLDLPLRSAPRRISVSYLSIARPIAVIARSSGCIYTLWVHRGSVSASYPISALDVDTAPYPGLSIHRPVR